MKEKMGFFSRQRMALALYIAIRKERMKQERDYFASEGESDPERLEAQRQRDKIFLEELRKLGIGCLIFLLFYMVLRTILGLW
ncbi:hypothetical protein [Streptococcus suis]